MNPTIVERQLRVIHEALQEKDFGSAEEANAFLAQIIQPGKMIRPDLTRMSPARRAQEIVYDAMEADGPERRKLAESAVELDPLCVDAHLILADACETLEDALAAAERAVEAGRTSLPAEYFTDPTRVGEFWKIIETRPFMRAMSTLADLLYDARDLDRAIDTHLEMLRLNPNDNQGVRYDLAARLVEAERDEEAQRLMDEYDEDISAAFPYLTALIAYRATGDSDRSRQCLKDAIYANPHVTAVFSLDSLPAMPEYYGIGDFSEAIVICRSQLPAWAKNCGFVPWMLREEDRHSSASRAKPRKKGYNGLRLGEMVLPDPPRR